MTVELEEQTEAEPQTDEPIYTHIVDRGDSPKSAEVLCLEARVNGTTVTALCGYTWTPSRDPKKYPVCQKCMEIYEFAKDFRGV